MQVTFKLSKDEIEHILIEYFQSRGFEPDVKSCKEGYEVSINDMNIERLDDNF